MKHLDKMVEYIRSNPCSKVKDIAKALNLQTNTINSYINSALAKGLIQRVDRGMYSVIDDKEQEIISFIEKQNAYIAMLQEQNALLLETRDALYYKLIMGDVQGRSIAITA